MTNVISSVGWALSIVFCKKKKKKRRSQIFSEFNICEILYVIVNCQKTRDMGGNKDRILFLEMASGFRSCLPVELAIRAMTGRTFLPCPPDGRILKWQKRDGEKTIFSSRTNLSFQTVSEERTPAKPYFLFICNILKITG